MTPACPCGQPTSEPTFRRVLNAVDVTAVEAALTVGVLARRRAAAEAVQARGGPIAERRCVLAEDEIAASTTVLSTRPDLRGVVVTADALHCQRKDATWSHDRRGHYVFTVKANQPTLRRMLAALPWAQVDGERCRDRGHGRTESRSITRRLFRHDRALDGHHGGTENDSGRPPCGRTASSGGWN